ncbi:MAG: hypothetical protein KJ044_14430, partial [Planctomycetes bacterium]|nr:hypothetical protein [Planctomycetota bacterium]
MRGLCTLIALAALTAPALLWLGPPAGGQAAAPDLAERFSPGLRRTARIERRFTRTLQAAGDTAAQTQRLDTTALVHEWYPQPDAAGRPARVVRTYRELRRVLTPEDRADGAAPVVTAADATPPWANMVLTLETANGELRVSGGAGLNDFARAAVAADFETDLQPQRAREVGRSWRIRGSGLEPLFDLGEAVEHEDGVVTVTLKSLDAARAVFEFSGALKFRHRRPDPADAARDAANLLYESTLRGSAEFDVVQGRWLGRTLTVAATISGTRDGREARGTAELSDRRVFTWGAIVDAPPPAESAFAEPPARPEVAGDGPVAPGRIVLGLANPARTALVEFDPVSGRVTRALARFPAGVAVGPPALSLDGSRLVFASTLHNDRT